ncbi:Fibrillin-2-like [Oopsacas minuta]|uniref:Fibrillin-2-like n=1 Tax=Oopsacas minuta TaxID=111878 RepID=A0AAV7JPH7_9METZ|nr:Fibrillin-2-like [Oopsacas minuta]
MAGNRTTLTSLVSNFELFSIVINQSVRMDNTISMENLALSYKHIVKPSSNDLLFQIDNSNYTIMNVKISEDLIRKANESCNEIVFTSIIFKTIKDLMPYVNLNKSEEIGNVPLISDVLSINTKNCINIIPPNSIQIEYTLKSNDTKFVCAFWNLTTNTWSIQGVRTRIEYLSYGNVKIICTPTHLTTFAILLTSNIPTKPDIILQTALSSVACSFSIVSLLASLICFITLYIRTRDSSENPFKQDNIFTIHINQCIALLFAILIFLFSSLAIGYRVPCSIIAGIQQYLWISVFGWFLCESIAIAWKIRFWDRGQRLWPFLVPLGWGLPFPVVIITVPITHDFYVDPDLGCWVTNTSQLQLISFILPILLIISVNIFLYIYSLVIIHRIKERLESGRRARKIIIGSLILLPLSAVPWIIGVFYVNKDTAVFGYMFVILVGIQGVFFFIIQVARSTVIQDYVFKWKDPDEVHSKFEKLQTFQSSTQELAMEQDDETTSKL